VVVASQGLKGNTAESLAVVITSFFESSGELPDHEGSVSRSGDDDWGFFVFLEWVAGGDAGDPIVVTFEVTDESELGIVIFSHDLL